MHEFKTGGYCPACLHASNQCTCWQTIVEINNKIIMDEKLKNVDLIAELDYTFVDVEHQLIEDKERWGDTWKERGLVYKGQSQEERFFQKMEEYYADYRENGTPVNWKKIIGEAHIALVREKKLSK